MISKSMLLVSDDVDDDHQIDGVADDAKNDRTHRIQLGGKFQVKSVKINAMEHQVDIRTPVPVLKTVSVNIVILRDQVEATGGTEVISATAVQNAWKIANQRYAQVGVRIAVNSIQVKDPPVGVDLTDGSLTVSDSAELRPLAWEAKNVIRFLGTDGDSADIHVFYVNRVQVGAGFAGGIALADFFYNATDPAYTYNIFMKADSTDPWSGYAAAHELGHLLTNAGHADASNIPYPNWHLMFGGFLQTNGISGSRRLNVTNEAAIQGDSHAD